MSHVASEKRSIEQNVILECKLVGKLRRGKFYFHLEPAIALICRVTFCPGIIELWCCNQVFGNFRNLERARG